MAEPCVRVCLGALVTSVATVNRIRGRRPFALPNDVGPWEIALYVLLPVVPAVIGSQGSVWDNIISIIGFNLIVLGLGYVITTWGLFR